MPEKLNYKSAFAVCLFIILILFCSLQGTVYAEVKLEDDGNLDWKIQRIINQDKTNNYFQGRSELENRFPSLFQQDTLEMINKVKQENSEELSKLKSSLFGQELKTSNILDETRDALFAFDYEAPDPKHNEEEESTKEDSSMKNLVFGGVIGLIMLASSALYVMIRNLF